MEDASHKLTGQDHDRIPRSHVQAETTEEELGDEVIEVSIGSKMLSAVSGSILTSLLVTPLDVVRVRLQSQPNSPAPSATPASNTPTRSNPTFPYPRPNTFQNLPPNLGITQCCKEVFWVTNNTSYCVIDGPGATIALRPSLSASAASAAASISAADAACAVEESQRHVFTSTLDGLRKIARNEGITTLWRGLSPTLAMAVPGNVVYFAGYDWLRTSVRSPIHNHISDSYAPLIAGSTARIMAALCVSPIELFRTRMQATRSTTAAANFSETLASVKDMVASQGPRSLWRGLTLTLWRDVPFSALYWWGYEAGRNVIIDAREQVRRRRDRAEGGSGASRTRSDSRIRQNHSTTLIDSFAAGAVSGGLAAIVTTPFDVGKTRQQVFRHEGDTKGSGGRHQSGNAARAKNLSMPQFLWQIYKEEGMGGLFKGWAARTLKVAPACAIMISTYEIGKKYAQTRGMDE